MCRTERRIFAGGGSMSKMNYQKGQEGDKRKDRQCSKNFIRGKNNFASRDKQVKQIGKSQARVANAALKRRISVRL